MDIVIHTCTADKLRCAFTLASATAIMEIHLYFTFWGLSMLKQGVMVKA